ASRPGKRSCSRSCASRNSASTDAWFISSPKRRDRSSSGGGSARATSSPDRKRVPSATVPSPEPRAASLGSVVVRHERRLHGKPGKRKRSTMGDKNVTREPYFQFGKKPAGDPLDGNDKHECTKCNECEVVWVQDALPVLFDTETDTAQTFNLGRQS